MLPLEDHSHTIPCLVYIPTWMVDFFLVHVGKYTVRPMDGMGLGCEKNPVKCRVYHSLSFEWVSNRLVICGVLYFR